MKTEEKILAKALEMFNEQGIEYVGMRELAAMLGMRVSNITYYFPTKDELVNRLSLEMNKLNSGMIVEKENLDPEEFISMFRQVFENHVKYRCLMLSFVHLMKQNSLIARRYERTQTDRNATLRANIQALIRNGHLSVRNEDGIEFLVSGIALIARFWISEAAISRPHLPPEQQIEHYLGLIRKLLEPHRK